MELDSVEILRADEMQRTVYCGEDDECGTVADFVERVTRAAAAGWDAGDHDEDEAE